VTPTFVMLWSFYKLNGVERRLRDS
jgi:hypothetical protein